jgi:hypothetical protein
MTIINGPLLVATATWFTCVCRCAAFTRPWITLSKEEAQAIIYHDGQYIDDNASVAHREEPLTLILQYAGTWCGFVLENPQKKRKLHSQQVASLCR